MNLRTAISGILLLPVIASIVAAETPWSRFRGQNGSGIATSSVALPWKLETMRRIPLEGKGHGSPAVGGSTVFLMSADEKSATRYLLAYDITSGKQLWKKSFESRPHPLHKFSSYASTTPFVDSEHVYFAWADPDHTIIKAFRHNGEEVWSRDFGRYVSQHGFGTSPIRVDDSLLLLNSQDAQELPPGVEPGYDRMVALHFRTGETQWETKLPTTRVCYGVPCIWEKDGEKQIVCSTTGQGMFGMSVIDGKILWNHDCFTQRVCASSVLVGDLLIGTQGSGGGKGNKLVAFDLNSKKERFQINKASPYVPCPVATGDTLFLWSDTGILTCVDAENGTVVWTNRATGDYSGSPVIINDKLVNVSVDGVVRIFRASRKFEQIGEVALEQTVRSTIVPLDSKLLIRTETELLIVDAD